MLSQLTCIPNVLNFFYKPHKNIKTKDEMAQFSMESRTKSYFCKIIFFKKIKINFRNFKINSKIR